MGGQPVNPFAPQAVGGINVPPRPWVDSEFTYVYDTIPALAISELRLGIEKPLMNDAEFILRAIHWAQRVPTFPITPFSFRFFDWERRYHSDQMLSNANWSANPFEPTPIFPEIIFPPGAFIGLDLRNDSALFTNDVQICFRGVKRRYYRAGG